MSATAIILTVLGTVIAAPVQEAHNITARAFDFAGITERDIAEINDRSLINWGRNALTNGPYSILDADQIGDWSQWAHYASAIYCGLDRINTWNCGEDCLAQQGSTLASGGDDNLNPLWYVADIGPRIVVGIAGTNTDSIRSMSINIDFLLTPLESSYFPNMGGAKVHRGFYKAFKRTSAPILTALQAATASGKDVVVTGHSQGAAVGMILALYLQTKLQVSVHAKLFAAPRVGNPDWADAVDRVLGPRQQHIVNFNDVVPHLPFMHWGYRHPSGEVYITEVGGQEYRLCEGQENERCAGQWNDLRGEMGSFFDYITTSTHSGPFAGVRVTDDKCPS